MYAIKRVPRERSVFDHPFIYDIFSEISSLEMLASNRGVCELIDFGVKDLSYWIVMEAGMYIYI
jgi:serine/threonine protein kinase